MREIPYKSERLSRAQGEQIHGARRRVSRGEKGGGGRLCVRETNRRGETKVKHSSDATNQLRFYVHGEIVALLRPRSGLSVLYRRPWQQSTVQSPIHRAQLNKQSATLFCEQWGGTICAQA